MLRAKRVPRRDGKVLGCTQFRNVHAAYDDLPTEVKERIEGRTAIHDFQKFWDMMRIRPITGRRVLYGNSGDAMFVEAMDRAEGDALLDGLFRHQAREKYLCTQEWSEGDVLMWDHIGTTHNAVADDGPEDQRFIPRVQVMASRDCAALAA